MTFCNLISGKEGPRNWTEVEDKGREAKLGQGIQRAQEAEQGSDHCVLLRQPGGGRDTEGEVPPVRLQVQQGSLLRGNQSMHPGNDALYICVLTRCFKITYAKQFCYNIFNIFLSKRLV